MAKSMRPQVANGGARSPVSLRETRCRRSEAAALRLLARNPISNEAGYSEYLRILSAVNSVPARSLQDTPEHFRIPISNSVY